MTFQLVSESYPSSNDEDFTLDNVQVSMHNRNQEVDIAANGTTVADVSNESMISEFSHQNLASSDTFGHAERPCEDEYKTSVSVDDATDAVINQSRGTGNQLFDLSNNGTPLASDTNVLSHDLTSNSNIETSEIISTPIHSTAEPLTGPSADILQSQTTTDNIQNSQQESQRKKHIMISYNQATSLEVCQKIYDYLKEKNYQVWFDQVDLHGSILNGMGEAVDNAYILLLCMNDGYAKSAFCSMEARYAIEKRIPVIPCIMEQKFCPQGGLGIIKSDLKHIEFFHEDKFEESMNKLINEINHIEKLFAINSSTERNTDQLSSIATIPSTLSTNADFLDRFNSIISDYLSSIQNCHLLRRENLNETEFREVLQKLINAFSPETLQTFDSAQSLIDTDTRQDERVNDDLLQHLLERNQQFVESLQQQQQQNNANIYQYLHHLDERLTAYIGFQERQEQENVHFLQSERHQNERLRSIVNVQQEHDQQCAYFQEQLIHQNERLSHITHRYQEQERNHLISERLLQNIENLTQVLVNQQQQQHARDIQTFQQLTSQSLERSESSKRISNQRFGADTLHETTEPHIYFDFQRLNKLVQTIILFWILIILLRNV